MCHPLPRRATLLFSVLLLGTTQCSHAQLSERDFAVLRACLSRPVSIDAVNAPLFNIYRELADQAGLACDFDQNSLEEMGVDATSVSSLRLRGVPFRTTLESLASRYDVAWTYRPGTLVFASEDQESQRLLVRVYPVEDLLRTSESPEADDYDAIIDMIVSIVAADSWAENGGGEAEIRPIPAARAIAVSQCLLVHLTIEDLLTRVRELRRRQGLPVLEMSIEQPQRYPVVVKRYLAPLGLPAPRVHDGGD